MAAIFPLDLPFPTAFYLLLYLLTLIGHVVFMNYVLAGCCYLAWVNLFSGRASVPRHRRPLADVLSDWMPFAISAAITMGVAPLLFIQIVYKERFYSANLLLSHRWMIMLPILILGFYLVYVVRSWRQRETSPAKRAPVVILAAACFLFAAWSWTENHLLSLDRASWPALYAEGNLRYRTPELLPRLLLWIAGSFPTMALLAAWQLKRHQSEPDLSRSVVTRELPAMALGGLILSALLAGWYLLAILRELNASNGAPPAFPMNASILLYAALALAGLVLQAIGWLRLRSAIDGTSASLVLPSLGLLLTLAGVTVLRELYRLSRVDITALHTQHAELLRSGGFWAFLVFALINIAVIAWCIHAVARALRASRQSASGCNRFLGSD